MFCSVTVTFVQLSKAELLSLTTWVFETSVVTCFLWIFTADYSVSAVLQNLVLVYWFVYYQGLALEKFAVYLGSVCFPKVTHFLSLVQTTRVTEDRILYVHLYFKVLWALQVWRSNLNLINAVLLLWIVKCFQVLW